MGETSWDFITRICGGVIRALHHVANHAHQPHQATIFHRVQTLDTRRVQLFDFAIGHGAAAATEDTNVSTTAFFQKLDHELEELNMPALVRRNRNALRIFFNRSFHNLFDTAVVPKVNDLGAFLLQNPPHDVDRGIVAIEQRSRRHKTQLVGGRKILFG